MAAPDKMEKTIGYRPDAFVNPGWYVYTLVAPHGGHARIAGASGPFATIQHAEDHADRYPYEWDPVYVVSPFHGSRFARKPAPNGRLDRAPGCTPAWLSREPKRRGC